MSLKLMGEERPASFNQYAERVWGGCFPVRREHMEYLRGIGVTLIITLTPNPLRGGRIVNFVPGYLDPSFVDVPRDLYSHYGEIASLHIPIADQKAPTGRAMRHIARAIQTEIDLGGGVYVHCWAGGGRTRTAIAGWMRSVWRMDEARTVVEHERVTAVQLAYVLADTFPDNDNPTLPPDYPFLLHPDDKAATESYEPQIS